MTDALFTGLSALALYAGWRVFRVDSMVRASFWLMISFIAVGGIGLLLSAPYIGVATVFMMAVEMTVMVLFMVMFMMNPAGLNPMVMVHQHRLSIGAGVVTALGLAAAALLVDLPSDPVAQGAEVVAPLGHELLGPSMLIFETAGVTLLATMVGAVILSSRPGRYGDSTEGARPPGLHPGGTPAGRQPEGGGGHHHHHHGHGHGGGGDGGGHDHDHGGRHEEHGGHQHHGHTSGGGDHGDGDADYGGGHDHGHDDHGAQGDHSAHGSVHDHADHAHGDEGKAHGGHDPEASEDTLTHGGRT
jgi:NADH:ubiquinone oxidoreductase subunit 6 (subunit J)